jgi:hypothetical protein
VRAAPRAGTVDEAVPAARRAFAARRRTEFSKNNSPLLVGEGGHHVGHHVPMVGVGVGVRVRQQVPLPDITRENENGCASRGGIRRNPKRHGIFGHPAPG